MIRNLVKQLKTKYHPPEYSLFIDYVTRTIPTNGDVKSSWSLHIMPLHSGVGNSIYREFDNWAALSRYAESLLADDGEDSLEPVSECCSASPLGELDGATGICSKCQDNSTFVPALEGVAL